jgi:Glycosyl transferase family 2
MQPVLSVVMGVYNGGQSLAASVESVLVQREVDLELVVVNDGSFDGSAAWLDALANQDARVRVIHQKNSGLTHALIRGCEEARGRFIARQDCGDRSLAGRFAAGVSVLDRDPSIVLTCCGARMRAPRGEHLFDVVRDGHHLHEGLAGADPEHYCGPSHHGATMFRKDAYVRAGGYRPQWRVAQDVDLWLRMSEVGSCVGHPLIGYEVNLDLHGISASRRAEQATFSALAFSCAAARRRSGTDGDVLAAFKPDLPSTRGISRARREASELYFFGACLKRGNPEAARFYLREAIRRRPFSPKALWQLLSL